MKYGNKIEELNNKIKLLEAKLIEQDHRPFQIVWNFLNRNKLWKNDDPRTKASVKALIWRLLFSPTTIAIASGGFLGIATLFFLFRQDTHFLNQNKLFELQNKKIDIQNNRIIQQTYLQEADRRSSLVFLSGNILDRIDFELKNSTSNDRNLSNQLIGRIVSLSRSFKPYRYLEQDTLSFLTSPERGQLLISLVNSKLGESTYKRIFKDGDFSHSEINDITFNNINFGDIKLSNSILFNVNFNNCEFNNPKFNRTLITNMDITNSFISEIDFTNSIIAKLKTKDVICKFMKLDMSYINELILNTSTFSYISIYQSVLNDLYASDSKMNKFRIEHNNGNIFEFLKVEDQEKYKFLLALNSYLNTDIEKFNYSFSDTFIADLEVNKMAILRFEETNDFPLLNATILTSKKDLKSFDHLFDKSLFFREIDSNSIKYSNKEYSKSFVLSALDEEYNENIENWTENGIENALDSLEYNLMKRQFDLIYSSLKDDEINYRITQKYYEDKNSPTYMEYSILESSLSERNKSNTKLKK
jgi:uncharacterized protein YjbI with pentapeptide repeats